MNEQVENLNWAYKDNTTKFGVDYTDQERDALATLYQGTLKTISKYEIIKGTVVSVNKQDVLINIGFKSEGLVSITEFRDLAELKPGDEVEVYIEEPENAQGQLVISRKKAKLVRGWESIQQAFNSKEVLEGLVKRRTKGGLIVEVCNIEAFLPGSQIDVKPILDFDVFVGNTIDVMVVKINHANDNVVVSHKVLIENKLEGQKKEIISNLEKGQVLEGTVKNMTKFGAFIDLGGVDGLLHITDISWSRVNHPEEVFTLGQKVKVVVIDFDEEKKRISLGMKQLTTHPWNALPASVEVGTKVKGKVVNIADYGIFLELMPGIEGLIHISEISWSQYLRDIKKLFNINDEVEAVVLSLDREAHKISLGIKQLTGDPWAQEHFLQKYAVGTKHEGIIRNLTHFGGFIELEPGIEGLLHISGLSWTKKIAHPSEVLKLGDTIETVVLGIDKENRRLSLGLKQLEKNPWDTYEEILQLGTIHKGTIIKKMPGKGAMIELSYGIEGYVPQAHLIKADGQEANVGEELNFQVIKFSKTDKKVIFSHQVTLAPTKKEKEHPRQKAPKGASFSSNFMGAKKTTLGDIKALAMLKEQMKGNEVPQETAGNDEAAE